MLTPLAFGFNTNSLVATSKTELAWLETILHHQGPDTKTPCHDTKERVATCFPTSNMNIKQVDSFPCKKNEQMVNFWFGARWFRIRIGVPLSNNPFHKGIPGIQTTNANHQLTIKKGEQKTRWQLVTSQARQLQHADS